MNGAGAEGRSEEAARPPRRRRRSRWLVGVAALALLAAALVPAAARSRGEALRAAGGATPAAGGASTACAAPTRPLRYPDVQPIFEQHCARCHDAREARNDAAQAVFEMTSYPFATRRPGTLLEDLRGMFQHRGGLSAEEKCRALQWLTGGALDADGKPPRWR